MPPTKTIVLATTNAGKINELQNLLKDTGIALKTLADFGPVPPVVEDGDTFDENAYKKASQIARVLGYPTLADDSGLVVEALDGAPGVYSARFGGDGKTDAEKNALLLEKMKDLKNRKAAFHCVLSLAVPTGPALTYEGVCQGRITRSPKGENGFGYDPVFYYPDLDKTFGELSGAEKSTVSHRGRALQEFKSEIKKVLSWLDIHLPPAPRFNCEMKCNA